MLRKGQIFSKYTIFCNNSDSFILFLKGCIKSEFEHRHYQYDA